MQSSLGSGDLSLAARCLPNATASASLKAHLLSSLLPSPMHRPKLLLFLNRMSCLMPGQEEWEPVKETQGG